MQYFRTETTWAQNNDEQHYIKSRTKSRNSVIDPQMAIQDF